MCSVVESKHCQQSAYFFNTNRATSNVNVKHAVGL